MSTISIRLADLRVRTLASGGAAVMIGIIFFLLMGAKEGKELAAHLAWSWMFIALGFAGVIGSRLIGCRSRLARVALWLGVVVFVVSIFAVKVGLTVAP